MFKKLLALGILWGVTVIIYFILSWLVPIYQLAVQAGDDAWPLNAPELKSSKYAMDSSLFWAWFIPIGVDIVGCIVISRHPDGPVTG